jgi:D-alanyl-D-alanine carboxypeptidase
MFFIRRIGSFICQMLFLLVICSTTVAQTGNETLPKLDSLRDELKNALSEVVAADELPGATLAVALPDGRLVSVAAGWEDREVAKPMPVGALMFSGSTGKTFVSAVALQLVSEGKFQLDDLVSKHFSDADDKAWFSRLPNAESLTVRSLMNHTSGLPRYIFQEAFLEDLKTLPLKLRTPRESVSVLLDAEPLHAVGAGWAYSDTNYMLLGMIIEKAAGKPFYDLARDRLLGPLKLDHTRPSAQAKLPGLTQGYIGDQNPFGLPQKTVKDGSYAMNPGFEWCGGGFLTNVEDLAQWMLALHSGQVLDQKIYAELIQPVGFRDGQPAQAGYGLGTFVWQTDQGEFLGHAGVMPGYLTQIEFSREHKFAVAFQTNTDQGFGRNHHNHVQRFARIVSKHLELE